MPTSKIKWSFVKEYKSNTMEQNANRVLPDQFAEPLIDLLAKLQR